MHCCNVLDLSATGGYIIVHSVMYLTVLPDRHLITITSTQKSKCICKLQPNNIEAYISTKSFKSHSNH